MDPIAYQKAFNPSEPEKSVNDSVFAKFKEIIDVDDDGDFDFIDAAIILGVAFAGYLVFKRILK